MIFNFLLIGIFCSYVDAQVDYQRINNYQQYIDVYIKEKNEQNRKNIQQLLNDVISINIEDENLAKSIFETDASQCFLYHAQFAQSLTSHAVQNSFFWVKKIIEYTGHRYRYQPLILEAIRYHREETVRYLMSKYNYTDSNYDLFLSNAVTNGQLNFIKIFLNAFSALEEKKEALNEARNKIASIIQSQPMTNSTYQKILEYLENECATFNIK